MSGLDEALAAAQDEMPPLKKGRTATVPTKAGGSYTYNYADIADLVDQVRPVLNRHGIAVAQPLRVTEYGQVLVTQLRGHGAVIESEMLLPVEGQAPQSVGSLLTYYRRYALAALVGVAAEDDDDGQAGQSASHQPKRATKAKPGPKPATKEQQDDIGATLRELCDTDEQRRKVLHVLAGKGKRAELTFDEALAVQSVLAEITKGDKVLDLKGPTPVVYGKDEEPFELEPAGDAS